MKKVKLRSGTLFEAMETWTQDDIEKHIYVHSRPLSLHFLSTKHLDPWTARFNYDLKDEIGEDKE